MFQGNYVMTVTWLFQAIAWQISQGHGIPTETIDQYQLSHRYVQVYISKRTSFFYTWLTKTCAHL